MAAFARLAGLSFAADELQLAERRLGQLRENYEALRERDVAFQLPPCTRFDPWPTGGERPSPTAPIAIAIPANVAAPANDADLAFLSVLELASLMRQRKLTSRRLVDLCLTRLERFDPQLHCVITLLRDSALATADERDRELERGVDRGPLHGIPYGAKDLFAWPGAPTTFGAAPFANHEWRVQATPLARLQQAGAVLCAKLSLGALAMGDLWHGGRTRNPFRPEQGSSGSSAGSASAVAAGLLPFALGTETLGSIVSPCRRCGVAGLRPTFGAVSRYGAMPLSWTMDKVGPIARTAVDAGLVFDAIRGRDDGDPATRDVAFRWRPGAGVPADLRVGLLDLPRFPGGEDQQRFIAWLRDRGLEPAKVTLPDAPYRSLLVMLHAEAATAFDEFTRDGLLPQLPGQAERDWPNSFRSSRTIPAVEYLRASRLRHQLVQAMHAALSNVDVLVAPTHGGPTLTATNLTGHPTYVLPIGKSSRADDDGRPTMLALVGQLEGEGALLSLAEAWQRDTAWHRARPSLTDK